VLRQNQGIPRLKELYMKLNKLFELTIYVFHIRY
jgi:hypothetical protein